MNHSSFGAHPAALAGVLHGCSVDTCSSEVLSRGCSGISAPCLEHLLPSFLPWCLKGCFSHFFSLLLTAVQYVLSFFTHAFFEVPPSCLRGSAVPCGGFVGVNWNWGSPGLSQRPPLQHWSPAQPCHTNPIQCQINQISLMLNLKPSSCGISKSTWSECVGC